MSAVVDYSKWDNLDDSDDDAAAPAAPDEAVQATPAIQERTVPDGAQIATSREAAGPEGHVMDAKGEVRSVGSLTELEEEGPHWSPWVGVMRPEPAQ